MSEYSAKTVSERSVRAVIYRADGSVEQLGLIAYYSRNPIKRWAYRLGQKLGIFRS